MIIPKEAIVFLSLFFFFSFSTISYIKHGLQSERNNLEPKICYRKFLVGHSRAQKTSVVQSLRLSCSSLYAGVCSNSCPLSRWCRPTISSSVIPFSSCLQPFRASESFPICWFFASDGQSIGASASTSVLPMHIQGWFPFGLTGWISLLSKGLSRVFSSTTVQRHQFFSTQPLFIVKLSHSYMTTG